MLQKKFLSILGAELWHTTHPDRYASIVKDGAILPEPDLEDGKRWGTGNGPENYPFVRTLGGVSLFDFSQFEDASDERKFPVNSWDYFVPFHKAWERAVWMEIDRSVIADDFISGPDLLQMWKDKRAYRHNSMPLIESAHLGPLPISAISRVYYVDDGGISRLQAEF